ncbi:right-handed parallel beta-helix repeat-containing protein [Xanthobacteraceae bacterium Astr-EGSB]|uniref:right-handed parallel beta-helix repeat-containing protein n=1 Tax=Astrobacterium formosum TaxID=3069710 RepID=UPI0027B60A30|nr:right-handed parallel beta-helix repeat-containing protein [Xanthobacteraceae bacterium Astr-EGSB]
MTLPLTRSARDIFSPVTAGGALRGADMGETQLWGTELERMVELAMQSGNLYTSKASLDADLAHAANAAATVIGDATVANNGVYRKNGASGTGSWTRIADIPGYSFQVAVNAGAGTANAIVATTLLPVSSAQLISLPIVATNTASPVTVVFNDTAALTIKTSSGNDPAIGGLVAGGRVAGYQSGTTFVMLSDQASAAVVAAAEAAATAAQAAKTAAEAAASAAQGYAADAAFQANMPIYLSRTSAVAATIPAAVKAIWTSGYAAAGDLGGAAYKRVSAQPSHGGRFRSTDRFLPDGSTDSSNGGWWEIASPDLDVRMFGAVGNGSTDCAAALSAGVAAAIALGVPLRVPAGNFRTSAQLIVTGNLRLIGAGKNASFILFDSGVNGLTFSGGYQSVTLEHLAISAPAATALMLGDASHVNSNSLVSDCKFFTSSVGIACANATATRILGCDFLDCGFAGISVSAPLGVDAGDSVVIGCHFINTGPLNDVGAGIYQISGGGWKYYENKILAFNVGFHLFASLGGATSSSLLLHGNSIEGCTWCVLMQNQSSSSGYMQHISIMGNQIGTKNGGQAGIAIMVTDTREWAQIINVSSNVIRNTNSTNGIQIDGATAINVVGNTIAGVGTQTGYGIAIGNHTTNGYVAINNVSGYGTNKVINSGIDVTAATNGP